MSVEVRDTRERITGVIKIARHTDSDQEREAYLAGNESHQRDLETALGFEESVPITERFSSGEDAVTFQEYVPGAVPLAQVSLDMVRKNDRLLDNLIILFQKLIDLIESLDSLEDLPDLWGLENFRCAVLLDPWFTHNIMVNPETGDVKFVDTARCHSFYSNKLGPRLARWWFGLMGGKARWVSQLKRYQELIMGHGAAMKWRQSFRSDQRQRQAGIPQ